MDYKIFDAHTDILYDVYMAEKNNNDKNRFKNYHLKQLNNSIVKGGIWTLYSPTDFNLLDALKSSINNIDFLELKQKNINVILGIEGFRNLKSIKELDEIYKLGIRHAMLTWNEENIYATGVSGDPKRGITDKGYEVLDYMIKKDMIIDLSHLNEKSYYDVLNYTNKNILVSHSNIKEICDNKRNLSIEQLKLLKEKNGLLGLTLAGAFIHKDIERRTIDTFIKHIDYAVDIMGIDNVCFGFDFMDYFEQYQNSNINEIPNITKLSKLTNKLLEKGYNKEDINKLYYLNIYNRFNKHIFNK